MEEAEIYTTLQTEASELTETRCPYETGYAIAVLCQNDQITNINAACQVALEELMQRNGFCRSRYNPWHYEVRQHTISEDTETCDALAGTYLVPDAECDYTRDEVVYTQGGASSSCAYDYRECSGTTGGNVIRTQRYNLLTHSCTAR